MLFFVCLWDTTDNNNNTIKNQNKTYILCCYRNDEDLKFVKSYKPKNKNITQLRILLHGPAGAGKSSFINSVDSVLQKRIAGRALADAISVKSFTKKV